VAFSHVSLQKVRINFFQPRDRVGKLHARIALFEEDVYGLYAPIMAGD
jgi:hypothetical protein